jgi:hypothetical protein
MEIERVDLCNGGDSSVTRAVVVWNDRKCAIFERRGESWERVAGDNPGKGNEKKMVKQLNEEVAK